MNCKALAIENENIENVHAVHVESLLDLKKIKGIRTSTFGAFKVLRHPGEYRIESSFYDECTRFITARSVAGLSWALSERSDLRRVLRRFETGAGWGVRPLSIVDLNRMIGDENIPVSREVKIIRSLRELVK